MYEPIKSESLPQRCGNVFQAQARPRRDAHYGSEFRVGEKQSLILFHSRMGRRPRHILNSSNGTSPIVPLSNLWAASCSPSAAGRLGIAINE